MIVDFKPEYAKGVSPAADIIRKVLSEGNFVYRELKPGFFSYCAAPGEKFWEADRVEMFIDCNEYPGNFGFVAQIGEVMDKKHIARAKQNFMKEAVDDGNVVAVADPMGYTHLRDDHFEWFVTFGLTEIQELDKPLEYIDHLCKCALMVAKERRAWLEEKILPPEFDDFMVNKGDSTPNYVGVYCGENIRYFINRYNQQTFLVHTQGKKEIIPLMTAYGEVVGFTPDDFAPDVRAKYMEIHKDPDRPIQEEIWIEYFHDHKSRIGFTAYDEGRQEELNVYGVINNEGKIVSPFRFQKAHRPVPKRLLGTSHWCLIERKIPKDEQLLRMLVEGKIGPDLFNAAIDLMIQIPSDEGSKVDFWYPIDIFDEQQGKHDFLFLILEHTHKQFYNLKVGFLWRTSSQTEVGIFTFTPQELQQSQEKRSQFIQDLNGAICNVLMDADPFE